jgi:dephospho-CoA kinase
MTLILGLTGSIGMGKSVTAAMFRDAGIAVHDADATVHELYRGPAAAQVEASFPGTTMAGAVDRMALGAAVLAEPGALARLESIIHPLVAAARDAFIFEAVRAGTKIVVLDVPLLFETGGEASADAVVVVTASEAVQKTRVLARAGMTQARFEAILAKQMPDSQKRRRAHFLVDSGNGLESARAQVGSVVRAVAAMTGRRARRLVEQGAAHA